MIDLHTHSHYSDGTDAPAALVEMAAAAGLTALALTDHDLLEGHREARAAARDRIEFVPGIELSVDWHGSTMHLLGYWVPQGGALDDRLSWVQEGRVMRNKEILDALAGIGIEISEEDFAREAGPGVAGRPHFAQLLVAKGFAESISDAFDRYLAAGRPAYRPRRRLVAAVAVEAIEADGGVSAVAHPHTVADDENGFRAAFEAFAELGVDGVECHYSEYSPEQRAALATKAEHLGLVPTGGSDYHGSKKPGIDLGVGRGDLAVPDTSLQMLRSRRRG